MRIVFCGVGALGSAAALASRNLDVAFRWVDFDRVESKNLLSQAFVKQSVGKNKAQAFKLQLHNFYGVRSEALGVRLVAANVAELLGDADLVVDSFDNAASRQVLCDFVRARQIACVHGALSADGDCGLVRWDADFVPDDEDTPGQPTCEGGEHLPFISVVAAVLARSVAEFVDNGEMRSSMISRSGVSRT